MHLFHLPWLMACDRKLIAARNVPTGNVLRLRNYTLTMPFCILHSPTLNNVFIIVLIMKRICIRILFNVTNIRCAI